MGTKSPFDLDPGQLNELLALGAEATRFSSSEKPDSPATARLPEPAAQKLGTWIDRYKLVSFLGEGGMAFVYLAEQEYPIQRKVALKLIKPGMDSAHVIARFEAERQALALLHHPNIAQIFDAGTTTEGRPYFVMEYVEGRPITDYCDKHKLTVEQRLRLFQQICDGIHHAHQRGIIHRDIKASNILIDIQEDRAVPKIIDFGVARATSQQLAERTLLTEDGRLIGTPEYMSPEQVNLGSEGIDVRSDVYALGVLLYLLLTGALPFDAKMLRQGGMDTARRIITEEDPKTPSTRLVGLAPEAKEIAERRGTEVRSLTRRLRRELEWIPLKAMRKEREERYQSASELAGDIQSYMKGDRLLAGPPSTLYRVKKFLRRHKALVGGTLAVLAVSLIGAVVSAILALGQAQACAEAQAVSDFLLETVLASLDRYEMGGKTITLASILDAASEGLEGRFTEQPLAEAEIRGRLGFAYWSLGWYKQSQLHYERAIEIYRAHLGVKDPRTLGCIKNLGWACYYDSRYDLAAQLFTQALEGMQIVLGDEHENTLHAMASLGSVYYMQGRFSEGEKLCSKAFETMQHNLGEEDPRLVNLICMLAVGYSFQGRYDEAERLFNRGLAISRCELGEPHWSTLMLMQTFGQLCCYLGRYNEAEQLLLKDFEGRRDAWGREHPDTLWTMSCLGWLYHSQGRYEQAESLLVTALEIGRRVLGDAHLCCLHSMRGLGGLYLSQGRYDESEKLLVKVLEIAPGVVGDEHWGTLSTMNTLAKLYTVQGRYAQAEELHLKTLEAQRRVLHVDHPDALQTINDLGILRREQQRYEDAESLLRQALDGRQHRLGPDHPAYFESMHELAVLCIQQAHYEDAEPLLLEAFHGRETKLGPEHPHTLDSLKQLVNLYESWSKPDEAEKWRARLPDINSAEE